MRAIPRVRAKRTKNAKFPKVERYFAGLALDQAAAALGPVPKIIDFGVAKALNHSLQWLDARFDSQTGALR